MPQKPSAKPCDAWQVRDCSDWLLGDRIGSRIEARCFVYRAEHHSTPFIKSNLPSPASITLLFLTLTSEFPLLLLTAYLTTSFRE